MRFVAGKQSAKGKAVGRPKVEVETATFQVHTTRVVVEHLKRLVATGYYGKSHNEAAEQMIRDRLKDMLGEEEMTRIVRAAKPSSGTKA